MVIETLTARLGGKTFTGHLLAALILDDPRLAAAARVAGDELDHETATAYLKALSMPAGYVLNRPSKRFPVYRLTGPMVPAVPGDAAIPDRDRVTAAGPVVVAALAAAYDHPVSGTDIRDDLRLARRRRPSPYRALLLDLGEALRGAHPLGVAQPHPVLGLLAEGGFLVKASDRRTGQVLWTPSAKITRLMAPPALHHPDHDQPTSRADAA